MILSVELSVLGAGYITKVGSKITVAKVGDPVGLSFTSCLSCTQCKTGHPAFCNSFTALNIGGKKECFEGKEGKITGKFFGQSSFASYTVVDEYSVINLSGIIKNEEELKMFAPFGCGFQTGSGTVANLAGAGPEDTVTVMGLGGVGLSAVMVHEVANVVVLRIMLINAGRQTPWVSHHHSN
jgi:Zn-dependent alcohol dehydrogenase